MSPLAWIADELTRLAQRGLARSLRLRCGSAGPVIDLDGRRVVNFGSNDYLGLAADPRLVEAASGALREEGVGAGASPLVAGRSASHERLEHALADFERTEAAIVFGSGFAANLAAVASLAGRGDAVFSDELNHASLIDGCRLSRAEVVIYPHSDPARLEELLRGAVRHRRRLIITESLFSMEGDVAPLAQLADLAERYEAALVVDEAHATGVFGRRGSGLVEQCGLEGRVHLRVGTLSKALGSAGGFACGSRDVIAWLVQRARTYVFSTAIPPAMAAAAARALAIVRSEHGRREEVLAAAAGLRRALAGQGWSTGASASQIVPLLVGDPVGAVQLSQALFERGYFVPAIRPPSVPPGTSRLRISVTAGHTSEMLEGLAGELARLAAPGAAAAS